MKASYVNQGFVDDDDYDLKGAIDHDYVPSTCLLGGFIVMMEKVAGRDPCAGCNIPRDKCGGRPKRQHGYRKQRTAYNTSSQKLPQQSVEMIYGRR